MADNVAITAGVGTTIAADDIGGVLHQRVKISQGADGAATDVSSAAPLEVTLANTGANATPVVVDLGANNDVTVAGVSTAANQTTIIGHVDGIETLLGTIDADTSALAGAVSGTEMQVDVLTMPTVTINSPAVTNAGTFAVQESGGALTALQIMDDWDNGASDGASVSGDVAHDTADAGEPVKIGMKAYELDGTEPQTKVAEADRVNAISDLVGRQYVATEHPRFWHVSVDYASAQTNASIKASPGAGLALYITDISISNGATAGNITLLDGSGGTVLYEIYPAINGGATLSLKNPIKLTDATALCITSTTVTTHSVFVSGFVD